MVFERVWDTRCPRVWREWQAGGARWSIQDLDPRDDELAVQLFVKYFIPDELLLKSLDAEKEEASVRDGRVFWKKNVSQRTSLACYRCEGDREELVALNTCVVRSADDPSYDHNTMESKRWCQVMSILAHARTVSNVFKRLNVDKILFSSGLLVLPQWRGNGLGKKLLQAREALCGALGVAATVSVVTSAASQRGAQRCGYTTLLQLSREQLNAAAGQDFPVPPDYLLKLMAKKYDNLIDNGSN